MKTAPIYILKDLSSGKFLARQGCEKGKVDSLKFAKTFTTLLAAQRKCSALNVALAKKDELLGKPSRAHFTLQLISARKLLALGKVKDGAVRVPVAESALAREARLAVKALAFVYYP